MNNMTRKLLTLCFIVNEEKILLGMKKRGFGSGYWNGFGGKVENDETLEEAASREVQEESKVKVLVEKKNKIGVLEFTFDYIDELYEVHIYKIDRYEGEVGETDEMMPQWFPLHEIPYNQMWESDTLWLPLLIEDRKFTGAVLFDSQNKVLTSDLKEGEG